ncbi:MAG: bifunctional uroporphyrinogen-III C-methylase/synthase, partial [Pseudanabaena sp. ELA607]
MTSSGAVSQEQANQGKPKQGKVYLVGAGVAGTAGLTRQALHILQEAEVLVYDALVDPQVLQLVAPQCQLHCVGKRGSNTNHCPRHDQAATPPNNDPPASYPQTEINRLLVASARQGKLTVRLKSGDPWIFGRAVSELQALHEAQCEYEVISGISSAIAAPLAAGIPLTDKEVSNCFAVLTGHDLEQLPWQGLGQLPTLVILMGTGNLPQILERLQPAKSAHTPIAIIQWCGRPEQKIWSGTLGDILTQIPAANLAPAVIVVGEVVRFRAWITITPPPVLPLHGQRILVTRAEGQASQFTDLLTAQGATVLEMPTLAILPPPSWADLDHAISQIENYDWLILTSANAVDAFFGRLRHHGKDSRCLYGTKVAVVGQKTAQFLGNHGIVPDLIPANFIADALVTEFMDLLAKDVAINNQIEGDQKPLKVLFPRVASGGREVLVEQFQQAGINIEAVA